MRRARGFTMVELAIVVSIIGLVVPAAFLLVRSFAVQQQRALFHLEVADATRSISEELRADLRTGALADGDGLQLTGKGECFPVTYRVSEGVLVREAPVACGGSRAIARGVQRLTRTRAGLAVQFVLADDPVVEVTLPLGGAR